MSTATHAPALRSVVLSLVVHVGILGVLLPAASGVGGGPESPAPILAMFAPAPDDALPEPSDEPCTFEAPTSLEARAALPLPLDLLLPDDDPPAPEVPFLDAAPVDRGREPGIEDLTLPADAFRRPAGRRVPVPPPTPARVSGPTPVPPSVPTNAHATARRPGRRATSRRSVALRIIHVPDVRDYYPRRAHRRGIEGVVLVEVEIDPRGHVLRARVVRSSGDASLDAAGVRLARDVRFARGGGGRRRAHLPVVFDLE